MAEEKERRRRFPSRRSGQICSVFRPAFFSSSSSSTSRHSSISSSSRSACFSLRSHSSSTSSTDLRFFPSSVPEACSSPQQRTSLQQQRTVCAAAAFPAAAVGDSDLQFPDQRFQPTGADSDIVFRHRTCTLVEKGVLEVRVSAANHVYIRDSGGACGRSTPSLWINQGQGFS